MPTIIDSLVISLGIDPSNFTKGQKQAVEDLRKTEVQATSTAKELEARGKQAAQFYSKIRNEVLALGAAFFGARGIEEFTRRMTAADTATGLLAKNLGTSTESLSSWEGVARRSGVSAADASTSMQNLVSQFQQFAVTGQGGAFIPYFQQLGISITDAQGKLKSMDDLFLEVAGSEEWKKMTGPERQVFGAGLGLTPGMVNVLSQPVDELQKKLADAKRDAVTLTDTDAATNLQSAWEGVRLAFDSLGRTILTDVTPPLSDLLLQLREFIEANKEEIGENFREFAEWLKTVDWKEVGVDIKAFAHGVDDAAKAVGGWVTVTEVLFGLWLGSKFAGIVKAVLSMAGAMEAAAGGTAAAAEAAAVVLAGPAGVAAVAAGAVLAPSTTNAGEDKFISEHPEMFPKPPTKEELNELRVGPPGRNWWEAWRDANFKDDPKDSGEKPKVTFPRPGTKAPISARKPVNQSQADIRALMDEGWNREAATGIAANIQAESQGRPDAVGDKGTAYGLAQWHPDRQAAFARWAGHDIRQSSRDEQIRFISYELRNGDAQSRGAGALLANTKDAGEAAEIVSRRYERPKAADAEAARRAQLALALAAAPGPTPDRSLLAGARASLAANSGGSGATTTTTKTDITIGTITVNTAATDADGVARDLTSAMQRHSAIPQLNQGLS